MRDIEMIATFKNGNIIPHRFRLENDTGDLQVIQIRHIRYREVLKRDKKIKFCVKAAVNGVDRELILWFYIETCNWYIDN